MRQSRPGPAALLTCLAMGGFAAMDAMTKLLVHDYSIVQTLWIRYVIFTGFALLVAWPRISLRSARPWLQASRGLLALVENGVFVLAFLYLPLADAHAVAATAPLLVIVLAIPLLGERGRPYRWIAVAAGLIGVLAIIRPGFVAPQWAMLIPLGGALLWAAYQVMTRLVGRVDTAETTLLWTAVSGLIGTTAIVPWFWVAPTTDAWMLLGAVGLLGSLCHYALIEALDFAEAGAVQPYTYTLLVWAIILGYLVFGDVPDAWTMAGAGVVVLSGLYTWHRDRLGV
jgi:drug/metabolite transporter (DMT)-like permease